MNLLQRYKSNIKGDIIFTGNTLGLCKYEASTAEIQDTIGVYTSLDESLKVGDYPNGTTTDYTKNGSMAILSIPENSTIEYCELIWSGTNKCHFNDVTDRLDDAVVFVTPDGVEHDVIPCEETKFIDKTFSTYNYYTRSADVTNLVKNFSSGQYSIKNVPCVINSEDISQIYLGWTLAVVYKNENKSAKNIAFWIDNVLITSNKVVDCMIDNFTTPANAPITCKLMLSAGEGDAQRSGEQVFFGKDAENLHQLTGPNNPYNNFFGSQINDVNGVLDTRGTFGDRNQDAIHGIDSAYNRQGYDITTVNVSEYVEPKQTSALIRINTFSDVFVLNAVAIEVEGYPFVATLEHNLIVDKDASTTGDVLTYSHTITNTGNKTLENLFFTDAPPEGTLHVAGSVTINDVPAPSVNPTDGFNIGNLSPSESITVTNQVIVNSPEDRSIQNKANTRYEYEKPDGQAETANQDSNFVTTVNSGISLQLVKSVNKNYTTSNDTMEYTVIATNPDTLNKINIMFTDTIPQGTTFIEGSVTINGISQPSFNPTEGFPLADLSANESATITFKVTVD